MSLIELIILGIFDIAEYMILSNKLIKSNKLNKSVFVISILVAGIIVGIGRMYIDPIYNFLIGGLIISYINYLFYKREIMEVVYIYILATIIIIPIQFLSMLVLRLFTGQVEFSFIYAIISQIISLTMIIVISIYIPIYLALEYIGKNNKVFKILIFNLLVLLISLLLYWYIDIEGILKNIIVIVAFSIGAIYVNFVILKNSLRNEYEKKQLQTYETYFPIINELIAELRVKQHEFDNHIQALNMLAITSTNYEDMVDSMKTYINELETDNSLADLIKLDNKILAGFLYSEMKRVEKLNIKFQIIIEDYEFGSKLKDYELIEIIGNLINNAFETGVEDNIVMLVLKKEKDMNVIEVRNKHPYLKVDNITKMFNKGFSTKPNTGRGYGLHNIKEIIKKYNGEIEVFNKKDGEDNYVVFRTLFSRN